MKYGNHDPQGSHQRSCFLANLLRGVHKEIHNVKKPCEGLLNQVLQVFAKSNQLQRLAKGTFCFEPHHRGHTRSPKRTVLFCGGLARTLLGK